MEGGGAMNRTLRCGGGAGRVCRLARLFGGLSRVEVEDDGAMNP